MTESEQKNIFGFNPFSEDVPQFEKTATFFYPIENEQTSSASTQGSEEERDRSIRMTPEKDKNIRIKMNGKTYTVRLDSSQKKRRAKQNFDSPSQTDNKIEVLPQIVKSERKRSEKQNLPSIHSLCFSDSKRTTPTLSKRSQPSTQTNSILEISFDNDKSGNILVADSQEQQQQQAQNENSNFDSPAKPKGVIVLKKLSSPSYQLSPLQESNLIQKPRSILKLKRNINSSVENNLGSLSSEGGSRTNKKYPVDFFLPATDRKEKPKLKLESLNQFSVPVVFPNTTSNTSSKHINLNQAEPKYLLKNSQQPYFLHSQRNSFKFQEAASLRGEEEYIPKLASSLELKCLSNSARKDLPLLDDNRTKYLSEVLDWKKRPSSKFRPQEMILDKIFNPSSCRNQKSQEFSFPKN